MSTPTPHIHVSAIQAIIVGLEALIVIGCINALARRFEGHPLADTFLSVYS